MGQTIFTSYSVQIENLIALNKTKTSILSTRSTALLNVLSTLSNIDNNPRYLLLQLKNVCLQKKSLYCKIVSSLSEYIGELKQPIMQVVVVVQNSTFACLNQFEGRFSERKQQRSEKINFNLMATSVRNNTNTIAFFVDTAINNSDGLELADETYEALTILTFISNLQVLAVHGTNANMGTVLLSETKNVSPFLQSCFEAFEPLVDDITKLISSASFDSVKHLKNYLKKYAKIIDSHNASMTKLLGPFEGVTISAEAVNANLAKSQ